MNEEVDSPREEKETQETQEEKPINIVHQRYQSFPKVLLLMINISLSSLYFGYTIIYLNVIDFATVMDIFGITMEKSQAQGFLTFCVPLGGLFGSLLSSYFLKNVSRRNSILYINYAAFLIGCLIFLADLKLYMILRVCQGMCAGLFSAIVPLLIKETTPFELSGVFGAFQQLFITIGIFTACFLSFILSQIYNDPTGSNYWKLIFGFPLLVLTFQTLALHFVFPYETPKYLVDNNRDSQARQIISYIYKEEFVEEVILQYQSQGGQQEPSSEKEGSGPQKQLKITKILALHLSLLQQFVGISAVSTYAGEIASGNLQSFKAILPSIINFEQVATAVISSFLLGKYGRKMILQFGTIGAVITNFIIALGFSASGSPALSVALILIGLFTYMINFGLSLGPVVWMYIPEIVPAKFLPYSTMINWGGSAFCILFFPIIKARLPNQNPALMFYFFAIWSIFAFFVNKKYLIETKNKPSTQIQEEYRVLQLRYCKQESYEQ